MPEKTAANPNGSAPKIGDVLVMGFTKDGAPFFSREHGGENGEVCIDFGRQLKLINIPEPLQFLFDIAETESLLYVRNETTGESIDDQFLLGNDTLVLVFDIVFADAGHEIKVEVMDELRQDERDDFIELLAAKVLTSTLSKNVAAAL